MYMFVCMRVCMYVCVYMYVCLTACMYACMYVGVCVLFYICVSMYGYVCIWPYAFHLLLNVYDYNSLCYNGGVAPHVMAHVCMPPSRCPDVPLCWPAASERRHQGVLAPP